MPAIVQRLDLWGHNRHEVGASQPSLATVNNPPTTLDASNIDVIRLTGTPAGSINLMTVADAAKAQNVLVLNNTGGDVTFATGGSQAADNYALAAGLTLSDLTAASWLFDANTTLWYIAGAASGGGGAAVRYKASDVALTANTAHDILAATHGVGNDQHLQVAVTQNDNPGAGQNRVAHVDVVIDDNGDVHITATANMTAHITIS